MSKSVSKICVLSLSILGLVLLLWVDFIYIHYNVWDDITYPFPNFNGCKQPLKFRNG